LINQLNIKYIYLVFMYIKYMEENYFAGTYRRLLPDARLGTSRVGRIMLALLSKAVQLLIKVAKPWPRRKELTGCWVNNSFDHNDLTEGAIRQLKKNVNGGAIIFVFKTLREINFTSHMGRIGQGGQRCRSS